MSTSCATISAYRCRWSRAGKLKLLGVATSKRMSLAAERADHCRDACRASNSVAWYAVVAPPKTPKAITEKINADINEALRDPAIQERLKKLSAEVVGGSTAETEKYLREEVARWNKVIKDANVKIGG